MDNILLLIGIGFLIGAIGTLIGAGGGFILVPLLIFMHPTFSPATITAISMAIVASNAVSGTAAYMVAKRIDYKAGLVFAICTIPGSVLGVLTTKVIPRNIFDIIFGIVLLGLAIFLFIKGGTKKPVTTAAGEKRGWTKQVLVDKWKERYAYSYDLKKGAALSILVGYFSPLLGIGGGIIHVPAMVEWLRFPVHVATATSHFILAIMALTSVITHYFDGSYSDPLIQKMVLGLIAGVIPGAQLGAFLSRKINGKMIIRSLAVALGIVGLRILIARFSA